MINASTESLTSKYDTNIFKAPEAVKEVAPDLRVSDDVPEELEPLPMKGTCHL